MGTGGAEKDREGAEKDREGQRGRGKGCERAAVQTNEIICVLIIHPLHVC